MTVGAATTAARAGTPAAPDVTTSTKFASLSRMSKPTVPEPDFPELPATLLALDDLEPDVDDSALVDAYAAEVAAAVEAFGLSAPDDQGLTFQW